VSWKEMIMRYSELSRMTDDELVKEIGKEWTWIFKNYKDKIEENVRKLERIKRENGVK